MNVTCFDTPHRPATTGIRYTLWTQEHDRQTLDLTPCASKLYRWLLERAPGGVEQEVDLEEFQEFTKSARRENGYHLNHIQRAFNSLQDLGFVAVTHWFGKRLKRVARLIVRHVGNILPIELKQQKSWGSNFKGEQATKKLETGTSNPDSVMPINREFKAIQSSTTLPPDVVGRSEEYVEGEERGARSNQLVELCEEVSTELSVADKDPDNLLHEETENLVEDKSSAPPRSCDEKRKLLDEIRSLNVPLSPALQRLVWKQSVAAIESAIAAFKEQQDKGNVKVPTAFMIRAIQHGFQPGGEVKTQQELEEFNVWYKQNKERILATYSHSDVTGLPEGQIGVMLRGSSAWIYWREVDADASSGGSAR